MLDESFKNLKIDYNKLKDLGFKYTNNHYEYETYIMNNLFIIKISIDKNNNITSKVIETDSNLEYLPYNAKSSGMYTSQMKEEYNNIIKKIKDISYKDVFKSKQAKEVIKYIKNKYNDEFEYLWDKFPENAITRNKVNNKWYTVLLAIDHSKINSSEKGKIEILDVRTNNDIDKSKYYPGYHMNKKHWITIILDANVDIKEIYRLIDNSYNLSKNV